MDLFDYRVRDKSRYLSTGITPGDSKKPVARGSTSSFSTPYTSEMGFGSIQFIVEPVIDRTGVAYFEWEQDQSIEIEYLYNGVYLISHNSQATRVVTGTGPIAIKMVFMADEVFASIDNATIRLAIETPPASVSIDIAPIGGVLYDKVLIGDTEPIGELVEKTPFVVAGSNGRLTPIIRDKLYDPVLVTTTDMLAVDQYSVYSRGAAISNTTTAFLSDATMVEKSYDTETWEPVNPIEYHGDLRPVFRSTDPDFTLVMYNTTMTDFIAAGMTTTTTGEVYKVGDNVGSYFSHDGYHILNGSIKIESDGMTSVTILGYIPDAALAGLESVIDYDGDNAGKMHLYTIDAQEELMIAADKIIIAGIGVNLEHDGVMDILVGRQEVAYADEIDDLRDGVSINGTEEYAILDLQWGL